MSTELQESMNCLREIGDSLYRVINTGLIDMAVITITRVETSRDLKHARVMVSVRGPDQERVMAELRRNRIEIQRRINMTLS